MMAELSPEQIAAAETFRTISFDYTMPDGKWDVFENEAVDWFFDAAERHGGQCEGSSSGPSTPVDGEPAILRASRKVWLLAEGEHDAELETLRGIARRIADGWYQVECVHWQRRVGAEGRRVTEPMAEAEVAAIYGQKEDSK